MAEEQRQGPTGDRFIEETEQAEQEKWAGEEQRRAASLFDLRRIIGGLFTVYGIVLIVLGITGSSAETHKAAGVNINLWAGIGMLIGGLLFVVWALSRPLGEELAEAERGAA
jgi:hypothetical protein